jgi:hypothetical protein
VSVGCLSTGRRRGGWRHGWRSRRPGGSKRAFLSWSKRRWAQSKRGVGRGGVGLIGGVGGAGLDRCRENEQLQKQLAGAASDMQAHRRLHRELSQRYAAARQKLDRQVPSVGWAQPSMRGGID